MDLFGKLSIIDDIVKDDDLAAISTLSLGDGPMSFQNIDSGTSVATPMKDFLDETSEMDIDEADQIIENDTQSLAYVPSVEETEFIDEISEINEVNVSQNGQMMTSLLSPTSLGIAAATPVINKHGPLELKQELRSRVNKQPINIMINHHHHYHDENRITMPVVDDRKVLSIHEEYENYLQMQRQQEQIQLSQLPSPWSSGSNPVSKNSYTVITVLQMVLNLLTVTIICSILVALVRTIKADISSTWEQNKIELRLESDICQNQFYRNKCDLDRRLPAIEQECIRWETCMNRDNDIFFRARTTLSAQLFGNIINSFVDPIGWKAICFILLGTCIWSFGSNFILGFARAKSYYGENKRSPLEVSPIVVSPAPSASHQSHQQPSNQLTDTN